MQQLPLTSYAAGADFPLLARSLFGNVRLEFADGTASNRLASASLGECRISRLHADVHTVYGDRVVLHADDPDAIKLIMQIDGRSELQQGGEHVDIGAGNAVVYDPTRPYMLINSTPVSLLLLQLPRRAFSRAALARLNRPFMAGSAQAGLQQIVTSLARTTLSELAGLDPEARDVLGSTLVNLVVTMLAPSAQHDLAIVTLRERAKSYIAANLARHELSVADIARHMGCTARYVFKAFQSEQTTPAGYLWSCRLERARQCLSRGDGHRSISEIAFSLGFSSSAHFSRTFRKAYGSSPREYRQAAGDKASAH